MPSINYQLHALIDTAAVLATSNPILANEQLGKEVDTGKFKIGDGVTTWNLLEYSNTNGNMTVFMGPSTDPDNLVQASPLDGGVALTKEILDFSNVVDQALAGNITMADRPAYLAGDRHKTASMLLGVFLRRVINAMGSNFSAVVSDIGYTGMSVQDSLASLQNSIDALSGTTGGFINDTVSVTNTTWSSQKIGSEIQTAVQALRNQLVGGAGEALDTIYELGEALAANTNFITTITDSLAQTVKHTEQTLTLPQQAQARTNIGALATGSAVLIAAQTLTTGEKTQVRTNIGAAAEAEVVKLVAQSLTEPQKEQARTNIGAVSGASVQLKNAGIVTGLNAVVTSESDRAANSIQILSHTRYGSNVDNGRGVLLASASTAIGNSALKVYKTAGDGVYESNPVFTVGGDDGFARIYTEKIATDSNALTFSNKTFDRPKEKPLTLAAAVNTVDIRSSSFIGMRPSANITLTTGGTEDTTLSGYSCLLTIIPTAAVSFVANTSVVWGTADGQPPTLPNGKATQVHICFLTYPDVVSYWYATLGPSFSV